MRRNLTAQSLGALLLPACAGTFAAAQEPPPLSPPVLTAPSVEAPAQPAPAPALAPSTNSAPLPESRPVLVVPGVTAPRGAKVRPRPPAGPAGAPELIAPDETTVRGSAPALEATAPLRLIPQPANAPTRVTRPLDFEPAPGIVPPQGRPAASPPTERNVFRPPIPGAPRRPSVVFGRRLPSTGLLSGRGGDPPRGAVTVEPRSDPAADAALKRRIERQIRENLGDRARSVEVRVVDRDVVIRARAARFWQKRTVRHALESLPALTGYHAKVEMAD